MDNISELNNQGADLKRKSKSGWEFRLEGLVKKL